MAGSRSSWRSRGKGIKSALLLGVAVAAAILLWRYGRVPQPEGYHQFADTRTLLVLRSIPIRNTLNVLTNVPFALVGLAGLAFLRRGPTRDPDGPFRPGAHTAFETLRERPAYVIFFAGVFFTAFGSGYYHLAPSTLRLFWDRLPMTFAFSALFAAVIAERISIYYSRMLLLPLVFSGIASVVHWRLSEFAGQGDLRPYLFVQLYPMVAVPLMMILFKARYSRSLELLLVVLVYGVAKALEHFDAEVYRALDGVVSGHSLKHLFAALATWLVLDMLKKRARPQPGINERLAADDVSQNHPLSENDATIP